MNQGLLQRRSPCRTELMVIEAVVSRRARRKQGSEGKVMRQSGNRSDSSVENV